MALEIENIRHLATHQGYSEIDYQDNIKMISFEKEDVRINVYLTKGTVATCIQHPNRKHRSQLFRKHCSEIEFEQICMNPRTHTGKGYFQK